MSRQLTDWITGYLTYTNTTEPAETFRTWTAISVLAGALQRKCKLEWGTLTFYPNMYIVLVGPSGARKGTAMTPGLVFLDELGVKVAAEAITREALIRELKNANATDQNITTGKMIFHSSLTIWAQELTVFLGYGNLQLMSDLCDFYDCRNRWTYRTKNMGTDEIIGVFVNLFGGTTPSLIRSAMPIDAIGGGLTSRIIFIYEEDIARCQPMPFLSDAQLGLREQLKMDLERIHAMHGDFKVTKEFLDSWTEWYIQQYKVDPFEDSGHRFEGYFRRRPVHVMKLSMIVNASRTDRMIIEANDFNRALGILEEAEKKMPNTFSGVGRYQHAETLTAIISELGMRGEMTLEELTYMFRNDIDKFTLRGIMDGIKGMGLVEVFNREDKIVYKYRQRAERGDA
jgi:hypothetical protein